jgi:hypothetical protein
LQGEFMTETAGFLTRVASPADRKAVQMLLASPLAPFRELLVTENAAGQVVAAAGVTHSRRTTPSIGPGVSVHVIAPDRRKGLARALVERVVASPCVAGDEALYVTHKVKVGSEEYAEWRRLGFDVCETVEHHEMPLDEFETQLAPLLDRLRNRGRVPASARIVPLYDVDLQAVQRLHLDVLGSDPETLAKRLRGEAPDSFSARYSKVLLIDDRVVGFILASRAARDAARVDANVLDPSVRNSWANVWLKLEATRGALRLGITKFVFTSFDHYTDTRSVTRRLGGITVETTALLWRPLAKP